MGRKALLEANCPIEAASPAIAVLLPCHCPAGEAYPAKRKPTNPLVINVTAL